MQESFDASPIARASDPFGQTIERIHVASRSRDEIRFCYRPNNNLAMRPLDLPEDELLALIAKAIKSDVFSNAFLAQLEGVLQASRRERSGP